jgi:GntR family transcriptional regulator
MFFQIDVNSPTPIYEQIYRQVKFFIANGALGPNELIPSVREVARALAINPQTVVRAYRDLQNEGVVYPVRGRGLAVAIDAQKRCRDDRLSFFEREFERLLDEAFQSRLTPEEIRKTVLAKLEKTLKKRFA